MLSDELYRVRYRHIKEVSRLLADCFYSDPLYCKLIKDDELRRKALPEIFECYFDMIYDFSYIYADSAQINGVVILFDSKEDAYSQPLKSYRRSVADCCWKTLKVITKYSFGPSALVSYFKHVGALKTSWINKESLGDYLHVDILAVKPSMMGKGIASKLMAPVLRYADENRLETALETNNLQNVQIYKHYGFHMSKDFVLPDGVKQFCMIRKTSAVQA
ncbi:GNAT family N-acetyltransferase [Youxingia wuxianensis]|uniref:GNAT family N-acetyltransferase n=1 Tax=Youxingia wuxianensis TaxID=2763678 RepID=A0A926IDJ2_9FIRM|nr:GNAT family N-acetyltransferase [Youxingia wuxianensis]MBC8586362.1 GNAT family N-acetyltransferase [Youxingia wuxianensis]